MSDRLWNLVRTNQLANPFVLSQVARRQLGVYVLPNRRDSVSLIVDANTAIAHDLGLQFTQSLLSAVSEKAAIPDRICKYLERTDSRETKLDASLPCAQSKCSAYIGKLDSLLKQPKLATAGILETVIRGLSLAVELGLRIQVVRILIRLAQVHVRRGNVVDAILILDDIEGIVLSNCQHFDLGLFHQCKAECLLTAAEGAPDPTDLFHDSLRSLQLAITSFDICQSLEQLMSCVVLAAILADQIGLTGLASFYAVKRLQMLARPTGSFFSEVESSQPKLPGSPARTRQQNPLSPLGQGRGIQTLISWSNDN